MTTRLDVEETADQADKALELTQLAYRHASGQLDAVLRGDECKRARANLGDVLIAAQCDTLPKTEEGLAAVDDLLMFELSQKQVTDWQSLQRAENDPRLAVWQGDITKLKIGAIVNAANEGGLGCFQPSHRCIDNVIHRAAGPRLRLACRQELKKHTDWSGKLPTGRAIATAAFCLPSEYVMHTPGPVGEKPQDLASCYRSVLDLCRKHRIRTVAFCCISTGLFGYPADRAAAVAVSTVRKWLDDVEKEASVDVPAPDGDGYASTPPPPRPIPPMDLVVFNCFLDSDLQIYRKLFEE